MSTILVVKGFDEYWIGCDSQVSSGCSKIQSKDKKYKIKDNYAIGVAGTLRIANEIYKKLPEKLDDIKQIEKIVLETEFNDNTTFEAIIIFNNELYTIDTDKVLIHLSYDNFGIGSGGEYAMAAYRALDKIIDPNQKTVTSHIKTAINVTSSIDCYTSTISFVDHINLTKNNK